MGRRSASALRITRACSASTWPWASAVRVGSWLSRPWASRRVRNAAGRVVLVWAYQFAVEVAPVWPAISVRSAWVSSRASSSASWAFAAWTSERAAVVSMGSMDHTGRSAAAVS